MSSARNKVFVAGHNGMVGSALIRKLSSDVSTELVVASRSDLDLTDASAVASSSLNKNPTKFIWRRHRWEEFMRIMSFPQNS